MQVNITYHDIWKMAYPVMIGSVAITLLNITDTIYLGRVGEVELGASALGGVFYFVMVMIGVAVGTGTQIQIARRAGEKNHSAIGEIFDHSIYIFLAVSVIQFLVLRYSSQWLFPFIIKEDDVRASTFEFLKYRSFGIFFAMMATSYRSFYLGIATPKVWGVYSFIIATVNIILAYILIFGKAGMPRMSIAGAGLASTISEFVGMIFLVFYTRMKKGIEEFRLFKFEKFKMKLITKTMALSAPLVVQNLISMGAWFIFFIFIEKMGRHALAISNITRSAYMINMTPIWGCMVAANSMVSNIIGQNRKAEVMTLVNRIIKMATAISLLIVLITVLIPTQLMSLFTSDPKLIADSQGCLKVVALATLIFPFAIVCISGVSGTGATRTALYIEVGAIFLYLGYLYLTVFVFKTSLELAWGAEVLYWLFTGTVSYFFLKGMRWEKINI
jgi:putative MATE family efflux protein